MTRHFLFSLALALAPLAGAWQDSACSALAAKVGDASQLSSAHLLSNKEEVEQYPTLAQFEAGGFMHGFDLWQQEVPELLRRTAETGDATLRSEHGFTALQAACFAGDAALIRALVEAGAPVDACPSPESGMGWVGNSPLGMLTLNTGLTLDEVLSLAQLLLEHGASPDVMIRRACIVYPVADGTPRTFGQRVRPLIFDYKTREVLNDEAQRLDLLLLQYGEQDYSKRFHPDKRFPFTWWNARPAVVHRLLKGGLDPNQFACEKRGPLIFYLVEEGDEEGVRLALERGAKTSDVGSYGRVYHAIFNIRTRTRYAEDPPYTPERAVEIARLLLDHGADINVLNRKGNGVRIHYGQNRGPIGKALCEFFKERGAVLHPDARPAKQRKK